MALVALKTTPCVYDFSLPLHLFLSFLSLLTLSCHAVFASWLSPTDWVSLKRGLRGSPARIRWPYVSGSSDAALYVAELPAPRTVHPLSFPQQHPAPCSLQQNIHLPKEKHHQDQYRTMKSSYRYAFPKSKGHNLGNDQNHQLIPAKIHQ